MVWRLVVPPHVPPGYQVTPVRIDGPGGWLGGERLTPLASGRHAALVLVVGSDISSYRTNYARLVNEVIVPAFSTRSFIMLLLDKRGVGRSSGDWAATSMDDRIADLRAALVSLASSPDVDARRVVVVGHSQGGWVAQAVAATTEPPALVISLAGPAVSVEEQIADDEEGARLCAGATPATAAADARALIAQLRRDSTRATRGRLRQFRAIADYRPDDALRRLAGPALFVFGEHDRLLPAQRNIARLETLLRDHPPPAVTVVTLSGAGHSLRLVARCHEGSERDHPYSPDLVPLLQAHVDRMLTPRSEDLPLSGDGGAATKAIGCAASANPRCRTPVQCTPCLTTRASLPSGSSSTASTDSWSDSAVAAWAWCSVPSMFTPDAPWRSRSSVRTMRRSRNCGGPIRHDRGRSARPDPKAQALLHGGPRVHPSRRRRSATRR